MPWHLTESLSIPALSPVLRSTTLPQQGLGAVVALAVNCHEPKEAPRPIDRNTGSGLERHRVHADSIAAARGPLQGPRAAQT